jgi:hypothetical protein
MAKAKRTTSPSRRATVATGKAKELICNLEYEAHTEVFGLGHLSELIELMGDCVGTSGA